MASSENEKKRQTFRNKISNDLADSDDPLALYDEFVSWTVTTYGKKNPNSGLIDILKEATTYFKNDPGYKGDLRYLKLWGMYAELVDSPTALSIYSFLVSSGIGKRYAALYLEYAGLLERSGRFAEADKIYQLGIKRGPRRVDKLEQAYAKFRERVPSSAIQSASSTAAKPAKQARSVSHSSPAAASSSSAPDGPIKVSPNAVINPRYAMMLAPPPPEKRPEKRRFNMSLLFTEDGIEYSMAEARARSVGLYGKQWGPPSGPWLGVDDGSSDKRNFLSVSSARGDDASKSTRSINNRRKSLMVSEPTMTMNTKEALADIYGMYNSPEKTRKLAGIPMRHVDPETPAPMIPMKRIEPVKLSNENQNAKTPGPAFRPFVDENVITPAPKFKPFVDPENSNARTPFITPRPALSVREASLTSNTSSENENSRKPTSKPKPFSGEDHFAPVFTPMSTAKQQQPMSIFKDHATEDLGKPQPKHVFGHQRALSHEVISPTQPVFKAPTNPPTFTPFVDKDQVPFKVFSRPVASGNENTKPVPKPTFTPFKDNSATVSTFTPFSDSKSNAPKFTPFRDIPVIREPEPEPEPEVEPEPEPEPESPPPPARSETSEEELDGRQDVSQRSWDKSVVEEDDGNDYQDDFEYDDEQGINPSPEQFEDEDPNSPDLPPPQEGEEYAEELDEFPEQQPPLGGRFGRFNVMTPITERTIEWTLSGRSAAFDERTEDTFSRHKDDPDHYPLDEGHSAFDDEDEEAEPISPAEPSAEEQVLEKEVAVMEERTRTLALADRWALQASFEPSNPCNPFDDDIMTTVLSLVSADGSFYELEDNAGMLNQLQKLAKKGGKRGSSGSTGALPTIMPLQLGDRVLDVTEKLGEGAFGSVFMVRDTGSQIDDDEMVDEDEPANLAIKVVKPRNLWEYHILRRIHSTIPHQLRRSIIYPHCLYAFRDESFLLLDYCPQGSLLDVVNNAGSAGVSQQGACLDGLLVAFFAVELLRLIGGMHEAGFIHGDLKIDNCLVRLEPVPGGMSKWQTAYPVTGEGGWNCKGLTLIDFGRSIDTKLFPVGQQFIADWPTDERDCPEVREDRPWTYQTDYYGLAGIVYCMLFGKYMLTNVVTGDGRSYKYKISTPFKRYWQTEMWGRLFDFLLNPSLDNPDAICASCKELADIRHEMEAWLEGNCDRLARNTLKGLLKKVEISLDR